MDLDSIKIELIRLILDINDAATLHKVKSILNDVVSKETIHSSNSSDIDDFFGGRKQDERTTEEILSQIHNGETKNKFHSESRQEEPDKRE